MSSLARTPTRVTGRSAAPRRFVLLLALAVGLGSFGVLGAPQVAIAWDPGTPDRTSEAALVALTNQSRASAGLRTLTVDPALARFAALRSEDMAIRDFFSHEIPPDGKQVFDTMTADGYCYEVAGENIGWLGGADTRAEARIQQMFLDSPTHRAVLMGRAWDVIGIGSYKRADGRKFWTVLFADGCDSAAATAESAAPAAPATETLVTPASLRVVGAPPSTGFFDSLVGGITGLFFGG
jgi:uncharacterized protein YkwD